MKNVIKKIAATAMAFTLLGTGTVITNTIAPQTSNTMTANAAGSIVFSGYWWYPKCSKNETSIVDALKSVGVDSSYSYRKKIAYWNNFSEYSGSASENTLMLAKLKNGGLRIWVDF